MKILTIHNLLWAHYKNALFAELQQQANAQGIDWQFVQIARNEIGRKGLESIENPYEYTYAYKLLFDDFYENISSFQIFKALIATINEQKPTIINLTGFYSWIHFAIIFYAKIKNIKIILSNDSTRGDNPATGWKETLKRWAVRQSSGFFCFGTKAVEYMQELGATDAQILARRCAVVDNQLIQKIHSETPRNNSTKSFIYIGRMAEEKNLSMLIEAFAELPENNWELKLMGSGNKEEELKQLAKQYNLDNKIHFISGKPWFEIPTYLAQADVLVLPSKSEPWGLVINEAMACKMPVVVSNKCGCWYDLLPEQNEGFVFHFEDKKQLSDALFQFIESPEKIEIMGEYAYQRIQQFSIQNTVNELLNGVKTL
jgi:glycosyltransferase involved in cell wall biosynthesis